jgi:hypothetical protein
MIRTRWVLPLLSRMSTRTLAALVAGLFVVDMLVPDPLPFVDEIVLGVATLLLARRRNREQLPPR